MVAICAGRRPLGRARRFDPFGPIDYSPYMEAAGPKLRIFVDADACPMKDEVYRVADRYGLTVFVVANSPIVIPRAPTWLSRTRGGVRHGYLRHLAAVNEPQPEVSK